jgi:hypothetical protein
VLAVAEAGLGLAAVQPAVHVGVEQVRAGLVDSLEVSDGYFELVGHAVEEGRGRAVHAVDLGHSVFGDFGLGAGDDDQALVRADRRRRRDEVNLSGLLALQHVN